MSTKDVIKAKVTKICNGRHGPYAVAKPIGGEVDGFITFSLDPPVWEENGLPGGGTIVMLGELEKKVAGWRTKSARHLRPIDEHRVLSTER